MYGSPLLRPRQFQAVRVKVVEGSDWAIGDVTMPLLIVAQPGVVLVRLDFHKLTETMCVLVEVSAEWR